MIKVAIIGCGGIGKFHSTVYNLIPDAEVVATADIRLEHAEKAALPHGAHAYTSFQELLANEAPDVIDLCTPSYLHSEMSVYALQLGFHVMCEKPVALSLPQAASILEAARSSRGFFMAAQVIRFWDEYVFLKKCVDENTFGLLKEAWFTRTGAAPVWSWDNWFMDEKRSGLAPFDLHIHDADFICNLLGKPISLRSRWVNDPDNPAMSYIRTEYEYPKIGPVGAEAGWFPVRLPFLAAYRVAFEQAVLDYRSDGGLMCYPQAAEPYQVAFENKITATSEINIDSVRPYYNEIRYFLDCIASGEKPAVVTPDDSYASLDMLHKEIRSAKTGKRLRMS